MEQTIKLEKVLDYICLKLWYSEWYDNMKPMREWHVKCAEGFRDEASTILSMLENVYGLSGGPTSDFHGILVNNAWKFYLENQWNTFEHPKG